jgi:tripartite-type tricarboxylate transporter receptor subunit TctC
MVSFSLHPLNILAQEYPSKPIQIIVPYSAGSTTDIIARLIAPHLSEKLKQPVSIDNRTGGGGAVGVNALKQAPKDGYTIGLVVSGNVIQPWLSNNMTFDIRKDFVNMTLMYSGPYILTVPPNFPSNNFAEFLTYTKANSGKLFFGSSGPGTTTHLAGELLKQLTNVDMTHVPYRGSPQVVAGMLSGDVQVYFDLYGTVKPLLDAGRVRALAVTGKSRMSTLPNLPPVADTLPGFEVLAWTGFSAPLGTPKDITDKLTIALRSVFQIPEVQKRIQALGVEPGGNSPAEFSQYINEEFDRWGKIIQTAGMKSQ